jgi:hypothetical protein
MGGRCPYGFSKVETRVDGIKTSALKDNIEQMPTLIKMYELYANTNMSLGKVSNYLNENNIVAPNGGAWDSCKISRILRNPVYVKSNAEVYSYYKNKGVIISNDINDFIGINGSYLYGKREINERKFTNVKNHVLSLGLHEAPIDSRTWLFCQYKLDNNKQIKNSGKGKHTWLSGYVKCGYCKYAVSVVASGHTGVKYFNCRGKTNLKNCKGHSKPIIVKEVESSVEKPLFERIQNYKNTKRSIQINDDSIINKINLQILQIDNQIENLINQLAEGSNIAMKYVNERLSELDNKKNTLLEEMKKHTLMNSKNLPTEEILNQADNWNELSIEKKKIICGCFIENVYIKDDDIDINWKRYD